MVLLLQNLRQFASKVDPISWRQLTRYHHLRQFRFASKVDTISWRQLTRYHHLRQFRFTSKSWQQLTCLHQLGIARYQHHQSLPIAMVMSSIVCCLSKLLRTVSWDSHTKTFSASDVFSRAMYLFVPVIILRNVKK